MSILSGEPWCLTPAEIGKLTLVQVQEIFFRPRDKDGNIRRDKVGAIIDPREEFVRHWRKWGVSKERAAELWQEKLNSEAKEKQKRRASSKAANRGSKR